MAGVAIQNKVNIGQSSEVFNKHMLNSIDNRKESNWRVKCIVCGLIQKSLAVLEITHSLLNHQATHVKHHTAIKQNRK